VATPIDLRRLMNIRKPSVRVGYELEEIGRPKLEDVLAEFFARTGRGSRAEKPARGAKAARAAKPARAAKKAREVRGPARARATRSPRSPRRRSAR